MRNLRNLKHAAICFGDESPQPLTAVAWDASDDSFVAAFGPSSSSPALTLKRFATNSCSPSDGLEITSWDAPSPNPEIAVDDILDIHCFPDIRSVCIILAGGDIVIVREEPQEGEDLIEIVGSVDAGIVAAAWSPDEELLALCTKADTFLLMTRDFEAISNVPLSIQDVQVSNHVSVGWGKSETQFKGRGAKALRDPTVPEHVDEGRLSESDDASSQISWRGDGQFLAFNSILTSDPSRRVIRIFSREGVLEDVTEAVDYLEGALSWKPSGQLIASIQRLPEKVNVVFFERNGLRHGEFSLRLSRDEMNTFGSDINLRWNADSSVLAVTMRDRVQLWTVSNYHYYLKQEIFLINKNDAKVSVHWHPEKALDLICLNSASIRALKFGSNTTKGSMEPPNDAGLVAVIDGSSIKLTPLRFANVPPPMAYEEVALSSNAIDVAFDRSCQTMAVLHSDQVTIWDCNFDMKFKKPTSLRSELPIRKEDGLGRDNTVRQISVVQSGNIVLLEAKQNVDFSQLSILEVSTIVTRKIEMPLLSSISPRVDHNELICHKQDGSISLLDLEDLCNARPISSVPPGCIQTEIRDVGSDSVAMGLTASGTLCLKSAVHDLKITGVSSFTSTPAHLIYTTTQHLLKFVHLSHELEIPLDEPEKDERCRSIERGAKIVTVVPSAYSLVLQMPRGNLETIYPRVLILSGIRRNIDVRDYKRAFLSCRTHRVDMNILHDYIPSQFMADVELVVNQLKKVEHIDLLLSSLSEDDVSLTIYRETIRASGEEPRSSVVAKMTENSGSKINAICDRFLEVLPKCRGSFLQSVITAHVCKNPPDLNAGLRSLSDLRRTRDQSQLDQGVEHICFLADVNQLYETALGQYDLDLALLIAQQSQKDPREYLPYLQSLQDMPLLRMRFSIDDDLKRYSKAISHLHAMEAFEELKRYVAKHELYSIATDLYRYDESKLMELMRLYAEHLSSRNRYEDSGIAYDFIGDHSAAYECYRSAGMWQECLSAAKMARIPQDEVYNVASDLAEGLEESKDFSAAAIVHLEYLDSLENALYALCKGYLFAEATRLAAVHQRTELLTKVVDQGLIEGSASMTEMLAEMKSQLAAQIPRLQELRQKKSEDPMAFLDGADGDGDAPDNISLAPTDASTSAGTFLTRYTNRSTGTLATNATRKTSKNKRREERKRARGKKGTVYEEEYLVNSIGRLMERVNTVQEDIDRLVKGLMRRRMRERATAVQAAFSDVHEACVSCVGEVFQAQPLHQDQQDGQGEARPVGGQGVLWDAIEASSQKKEVPFLKAFQKLSLIS